MKTEPLIQPPITKNWQRMNNPFIPIEKKYYTILIAIIILQLVIAGIQCFYSLGKETIFASTAHFIYLLILNLPVIFYRPSFGWFHPLVFGSLLSLVSSLPTFIPNILAFFFANPSFFRYTLEYHEALPGWNPETLTTLTAYAWLLNCLALIAYYIGFFVCPKVKISQINFKPFRNHRSKLLLVVIFSFILFSIFLHLQGGLTQHLYNNWTGGRSKGLSGELYWDFAIKFASIACMVWLGIDRRSTRQPLFWGSVTLSLLMIFLFGGSRSAIIYPAFVGIMIWMLREGRFFAMRLFALLMIGFIALGTLGLFRAGVQIGNIEWNKLIDFSAGIEKVIGSDDQQGELNEGRGSSSTIAILARVPENVDFLYGESYLNVIALPIPRKLWKGKPVVIQRKVGETFFGVEYGKPPGAMAEAYWNFGIPGVALVFFIFGWFHKWLTRWFRKYSTEPIIIVFYSIILFYSKPSSPGIVLLLYFLVPLIFMLTIFGVLSWKRKKYSY